MRIINNNYIITSLRLDIVKLIEKLDIHIHYSK